MNATLKELHRKPGKVLAAVEQRQQTVQITRHGKVVAQIQPRPPLMSPEEFGRLWEQRKPLDPETAADILAALRDLDRAG